MLKFNTLIVAALAVIAVFGGSTQGIETQQAVVYLHGGRDFALRNQPLMYRGLLARELVRQALLLAAREELACTTRDLHLGQAPPEGASHLDIVSIFGAGGEDGPATRLELLRGQPPAQELFASEAMMPAAPIGIVDLTTDCEARSRGSFVTHLKQAGLSGKPPHWNADAEVPSAVPGLLAEMNFVPQWRAACLLHAEMTRRGASPSLMAALVRAYANLGVLTELHWAPAHDVFTARSLLYAQRLVVQQPQSGPALTARAYAYALAGLHAAALSDLDSLEKLAFGGEAKPDETSVLIRDFCRFRIDLLTPNRFKAESRELVRLLRCLVREQSDSERQTIEEALDDIKALPHCYRIQTSLCQRAGVSLGHSVTLAGPSATAKTIYPRLIAMKELPDEARAVARNTTPGLTARLLGGGSGSAVEFAARAKVIAALMDAKVSVGEQDELTWPVLGRMIAEHSFQEVFRRADFEHNSLGVPTDDWLNAARPLYEGHPFASLLQSFRRDEAVVQKAIAQAATIDLDTIEMQAQNLETIDANSRTQASKRRAVQVAAACLDHMDYTMNDLARRYPSVARYYQQRESKIMFELSPYSPQARNAMVAFHWNEVRPQIDQWLVDAEGDAAQLAAIGRHYSDDKQYDKAVPLLRKACDLSPELDNLRLLANAYRLQGKIDEWQNTLSEFLKQPDYALEHAGLRKEIAAYYMERHEWRKALPFAHAAAKSYASWGLLLEAQCQEALEDWPHAEALYRVEAERYETLSWFFFTRRTGQGNAAAALAYARTLINGPVATDITSNDRVAFHLALGDAAAAREIQEVKFRELPNNQFVGLLLATLADQLGDSARRDAALKHVAASAPAKKAKTPRTGFPALAEALVKDLASGGHGEFNLDALSKLRSKLPASDDIGFDYLAGCYFDQHGKSDEARKAWLRCMLSLPLDAKYRTLAGAALLKRGVTPAAYTNALQRNISAPPPPF
jgi:tetratricopeptide (TPR) repeat protein